jgi:hypothetical protein
MSCTFSADPNTPRETIDKESIEVMVPNAVLGEGCGEVD